MKNFLGECGLSVCTRWLKQEPGHCQAHGKIDSWFSLRDSKALVTQHYSFILKACSPPGVSIQKKKFLSWGGGEGSKGWGFRLSRWLCAQHLLIRGKIYFASSNHANCQTEREQHNACSCLLEDGISLWET